MSAYQNQPENLNFLSPLGFGFKIKKAPHINYFVQSVAIPSISIAAVEVPTPFSKLPYAGTSITYDPLSITFKVDEDMENYTEIFTWIEGMGFPEKFDQYKKLSEKPMGDGIFSDVSVFVLTSAKNPNKEIVFIDAFPISLSELRLQTTDTDVEHITATVDFRYSRFVMKSVQ